MPRQFERIALGAAYDSAVGAEQCCYNVYDSRLDDFLSQRIPAGRWS